MMLNIFFCVYWPFVYLLWRDVYSDTLTRQKLVSYYFFNRFVFSFPFFFFFWQRHMWDPSSPTRDRTCTPRGGSMESQPLDCQGSPWVVLLLSGKLFLIFFLISSGYKFLSIICKYFLPFCGLVYLSSSFYFLTYAFKWILFIASLF